jgi:ATPase subunit of ABC transporter with duplicated ATPase domains
VGEQQHWALGSWLSEGNFSLLLVSHDRRFLDKTVEEVLEIDEESLTVSLFGGNYSFYAAKRRKCLKPSRGLTRNKKEKGKN